MLGNKVATNLSRVKPVFKCGEIIHKEQFKAAQCLLTISVGQEVHEAEKFATTIELVNSNFASSVVLIDDSLQRHTMALDTEYDAEYFYAQSMQEGDAWLERNDEILKKLKILNKIIRWDVWLQHPRYTEWQNEIKAAIDVDPLYRKIFEETIAEFLRRYTPRMRHNSDFVMQKAKLLCFDYLLEECAAMCLWPELDCHFEVYPSQRNPVMAATHARFVLPCYPELLHAVAIKFKNRKQLKPQSFELLQNQASTTAGSGAG